MTRCYNDGDLGGQGRYCGQKNSISKSVEEVRRKQLPWRCKVLGTDFRSGKLDWGHTVDSLD